MNRTRLIDSQEEYTISAKYKVSKKERELISLTLERAREFRNKKSLVLNSNVALTPSLEFNTRNGLGDFFHKDNILFSNAQPDTHIQLTKLQGGK